MVRLNSVLIFVFSVGYFVVGFTALLWLFKDFKENWLVWKLNRDILTMVVSIGAVVAYCLMLGVIFRVWFMMMG